MADRLIELALETLETRKAAIEAEIQQLRAQLRSPRRRGPAARPAGAKAGVVRRRPRSAAARKAQSQRMKEYWARKRAEGAAKTSSKGKQKE
jgi:hypothetical protein